MAFLLAFLGVACCLPVARAQIVVDRSFGAGGALAPTNGNFDITAGLGRTVGSNLFHSFDQFNINTGQSATFSGPNSIANVISRVTGPNASNIDGTLRSTIPGADVYLINPNGVVFGPNARLDVKGSFAASTADKIRLKDGGVFHASQPSTSSLTSAPPAAFGFLGSAPKALAVHGSQLSVPAGKAVSLVGGDLSVRGGAKVSAPAGRINAVSVASPGEVAIDHSQPSAPIDTSTIATLGKMEILEGSSLDTSDGGAVDAEGRGGGAVFVRAGQLTMDNSSILSLVQGEANGRGIDVQVTGDMTLSNVSVIDAGSRDNGRGGDVFVKAGNLSLDGQSPSGDAATRIATQATGAGAAGNLAVDANNLSLSNRAFFDAGTSGAGASGNLTINAAASLKLTDGGAIFAVARAGSTGTVGNLSITSPEISLSGRDPIKNNQSFIRSGSEGTGASGRLLINAEKINIYDGGVLSIPTSGAVDGGGSIITASKALNIREGGQINRNSFGTGNSGVLIIDAGRLLVDGTISSEINDQGNGGLIFIKTGSLKVGETGFITTTTYNKGDGADLRIKVNGTAAIQGKIFVDVGDYRDATDPAVAARNLQSSGHGGRLSITAQDIIVTGQKGDDIFGITVDTYSTASEGLKRAGSIFLQALGTVQLDHQGYITADSYGSGGGGNLNISAANVIVTHGTIRADVFNSGSGNGGDISIKASETLKLGKFASINADTQGSGQGGNVSVTANDVFVKNRSFISADVGIEDHGGKYAALVNSQSTGPGGKVQIIAANSVQILDAGIISADTYATGNGGNVSIKSPNIVVSGHQPDPNDPNNPFASAISVEADAQGNAGNLKINGNNLTVDDFGTISADTLSTGSAGNITLSLSGSVKVSAGGTIEARSTAPRRVDNPGRAGNITLLAADLLVAGSAFGIDSSIEVDSGRSKLGHGDLSVQVNNLTLMDGGQLSALTFGSSDAGDISVTANNSLQLLSGGAIVGDATTGSSGQASDINISSQYISVSGHQDESGVVSEISSSSRGTGAAGRITLTADQLLVNNGGKISTDAGVAADAQSIRGSLNFNVGTGLVELRSGGVISAQTSGSAAGGSIIMTAGRLSIDGENSQLQALSTGENSGAGKAGRLNITVDGPIALTNGGTITTNASNATGGSIKLTTNADLQLSDGASIDAKSVGGGGNVNLDVGDSLIAMNGGISATTTGATAQGGNVIIEDRTHFIILVDTPITARAVGGTGGTITNDADFSFATSQHALAQPPAPEFDPNGLINPFDASSASGNPGTIVTRAPNLSLTSTLGQVTYRTPDLVVVAQYPASEKQLAEAKAAADQYLDAVEGKPAPMPASMPETPAPPSKSLKRNADTPAKPTSRAAKRAASSLAAATPRRPRRPDAAPQPIRPLKSGVIAVQVSKKSESSSDTIGVVLIDAVSRQPTSPDVYEISKKRLGSGDAVTIEGQSATLVARNL